jgi:hypothetical protein
VAWRQSNGRMSRASGSGLILGWYSRRPIRVRLARKKRNARDARRVDTEVLVGQLTLVAPSPRNCCLSSAILAQGALHRARNGASRRLPALTDFPQSARPCVIERDGVIWTPVSYSYLKATIGSIFVALRAGT